jgi:NAD(P)-dependent dehydrogenase (short-subunit alcohol dehydrogenase family)
MTTHTRTDMTGRVVLITGANSGIGKAAAIELARMGATVVMAARNEVRGAAALAEVRRRSGAPDSRVSLLGLDLARFRSIRACARQFLDAHDRLDVLVNNAGGIIGDRRVTEDGFEMTFGVNHLGGFALTQLLIERIEKSAPARIINVSSIAHRLAGGMSWSDLQHELGYNGTVAYNESKLANVLFTRELARRLDGTGVTANCLHPGAVRSGFGGGDDMSGLARFMVMAVRPFEISPHRGAQPIIRLASSPDYADTTGGYFVGGYLTRCSPHRPAAAARDAQAARRLWDVSEELVASIPVT